MLRSALEEEQGLMDEIRTPWRMRFIAAAAQKAACIFCPPSAVLSRGGSLSKGTMPPGEEEPGRERFVLHHGTTAFVILNLYPYTTGHLMVVPYRHLPRFGDLSGEERAELARLLRESERILRAATGARRFHAGINLGRAAGAGVEGHLHAHLVPRDARAEWADAPGAEEPALPVEEAFRRLAPHFTAESGSAR
jgi:ATP adenylyltransferase